MAAARVFDLPSDAARGVDVTAAQPLTAQRWLVPEGKREEEKQWIRGKVRTDRKRFKKAKETPLPTKEGDFLTLPVARLDLAREARETGVPSARRLGSAGDPVGYVVCFAGTPGGHSLRRLNELVAELHDLGEQTSPYRGAGTGAAAVKLTNTGTSGTPTSGPSPSARFSTRSVDGKGPAYVDEVLNMVGEELDTLTEALEAGLRTDVLTRTSAAYRRAGLRRSLLGKKGPWTTCSSSTGQRNMQHLDKSDGALCLLGAATEEPYLFGISGLGYAIELDADTVVLFDARRHLHGVGGPPTPEAMAFSFYVRTENVEGVVATEEKLTLGVEAMQYAGAAEERAAARSKFDCGGV